MSNSFFRKLSLALAAFTLSALIPFSAWALEPDAQPLYRGIDVSRWQGEIDFQKVKEAGIQVVYIRAAVGSSYKDPYFEQNYRNAKAAGLKVGFYQYITAKNTHRAQQEARYFASLISGLSPDCRPAMDFEVFYGLGGSQVNQIAQTYLRTLEELTGHRPIVYSDASNARSLWNASLSAYPLWVADYGPALPPDNGKWSGWAGFQYADDGRISGISGNVDLDRFTPSVFLTEEEPSTVPSTQYDPTYQVQPGDTLWRIAQRYRTTVAALASLNGIADPNLIYPGQILKLPGTHMIEGNPQNPETGLIRYTIRPGDTLSAIAKRYHTTVAALAGLNHISNPNLIYAGDTLLIPA